MTGELAERFDLRIRVVECRRRGRDVELDSQRFELALNRVAVHHDEIRFVSGDRLDIRFVTGEIGRRHAFGEVGLIVDRNDLIARTYCEQHLGRGG